jgi:hypothetical protein
MSKHLMVDLETLATSPNAAILTIGAVTFDPKTDKIFDEFYTKVDLESVTDLGMQIDEKTVEWWGTQDAAAQEEAFSETNRISVQEAIEKFHKFAWNCSNFWSHGAAFDIVIIEQYYRALKKSPPWDFWQIRDTRTIFDLGIDPEMPQANKHHALEDARRQAIGVQNVYKKLLQDK